MADDPEEQAGLMDDSRKRGYRVVFDEDGWLVLKRP
jgi:hypothetical protein